MVWTLIRLRFAIMRHAYRGSQKTTAISGAVIGLLAARATWYIAFIDFDDQTVHRDSMALLFGIWTVGWALGPTLFGREDTTLRPEHYRFLPVQSSRLAAAMLTSSVLSIAVAVSLIAFAALVAYGALLGFSALLFSVPAFILQLTFAVALSRYLTSALRRAKRTQLSAIISAASIAIIQAFLVTGWALFALDLSELGDGYPAILSFIGQVSPSGWGVVSIYAAADGSWFIASAALLGLAVGTGMFTLLWSRLIRIRITTVDSRTSAIRSYDWITRKIPVTPVGAILRKEIVTWLRDSIRAGDLYFAFFYSLALCLFPLAAGFSEAVPWAGVLFVLTAVGIASNVYGYDGTSLWLTLTTPGAAPHDVRGRQQAWILVVGPVALFVSTFMTIASSQSDMLLITLAATITSIGIGSGVMIGASVYWMTAAVDPAQHRREQEDPGGDPGRFLTLVFFSALLASPGIGLALAGYHMGISWLEYLGASAGILSGVLVWWAFGRLATVRLESHGPEMMNVLLKGPQEHLPGGDAASESGEFSTRVWIYTMSGIICLVPQSIVPLIFILDGTDSRVWFVALYLPGVWRLPASLAFGVVGIGLLTMAYRTYRTENQR